MKAESTFDSKTQENKANQTTQREQHPLFRRNISALSHSTLKPFRRILRLTLWIKKKELFSSRRPPYSHVPTSGSGSSSEHREQVDPQRSLLRTDRVGKKDLHTAVQDSPVISDQLHRSPLLHLTVQILDYSVLLHLFRAFFALLD